MLVHLNSELLEMNLGESQQWIQKEDSELSFQGPCQGRWVGVRLVSSANHLRKQLTRQFFLNAFLWPLTLCCFPLFTSSTSLFLSFKRTDDTNHFIPHLLHGPGSSWPYLSSPLLELPVSNISFPRSTLPAASRANSAKHRSGPVPLLMKRLRGFTCLQDRCFSQDLGYISLSSPWFPAACTPGPTLPAPHPCTSWPLQMQPSSLLSACLAYA